MIKHLPGQQLAAVKKEGKREKMKIISKCVRQSRIFIARILILLRKVLFNHHHINLTAEFRKDIAWWRRFLRAYNGVSIISTAQWSSPGEVFTTDACLTGCGGLCGDQYFHAAFPSFVVQQTLDINCLELLTIIVALKLWGLRWSGLRLYFRLPLFSAERLVQQLGL